jgi:hypothetical protein
LGSKFPQNVSFLSIPHPCVDSIPSFSGDIQSVLCIVVSNYPKQWGSWHTVLDVSVTNLPGSYLIMLPRGGVVWSSRFPVIRCRVGDEPEAEPSSEGDEGVEGTWLQPLAMERCAITFFVSPICQGELAMEEPGRQGRGARRPPLTT